MIHTLLVHNDHDQVHGLTPKLKAPTAAGNSDRGRSAPAIGCTACSYALTMVTAKADRNFHHRWNYGKALRFTHYFVRDCFVGSRHDLVQHFGRGINPLSDVGFVAVIGGPARSQ